MTQKLYYEDAYIREFKAVVTAVKPHGEHVLAALDRSAFYPTGGGQPFDTGTLSGLRVVDVNADGQGVIWHEIEGQLKAGEAVTGIIDWPRRFDHMQQHAGEHILAYCCRALLGGHTIGLHLGAQVSTIDVELPGGATHITDAQADELEAMVNGRIQRDVPIRCFFPDEAELAALPLRKPPTVNQDVRVVQVGDFEYVACGGTHPSSSGQIGALKLLDYRPSKGKLRLSFVCGARANRDHRIARRALDAMCALLSAPVDSAADALGKLMDRQRELEDALRRAALEKALAAADEALARAPKVKGAHLVTLMLEGSGLDILREAVGRLIATGEVIALCACREEGEADVKLVFASSSPDAPPMNQLLREAASAYGGKGGGRPEYAQGSARDAAVLSEAERRVLAAMGEGICSGDVRAERAEGACAGAPK